MNPALLRQFYENTPLREAVKVFMIESLKEIAVEKAFTGQNTDGIKDAADALEKSFDTLDSLYGKIKESTTIPNSR